MSKSNIIRLDYQGLDVGFTEDGWLNATAFAERFGKRVNDFLSLPTTKEYIAALDDEEISNTGKSGIWFRAKRGNNGGTWLHPDLAVRFAQWLDVRFAIWCDRQIKTILSRAHPHYARLKARDEAAASFKPMNETLRIVREEQGKITESHHYANEARLMNWIITGEFAGLDRDALPPHDLVLLAKLEVRNTVLIGRGVAYPDRKQALEQFASDWRAGQTLALRRAARWKPRLRPEKTILRAGQ